MSSKKKKRVIKLIITLFKEPYNIFLTIQLYKLEIAKVRF